MKPAGKSRWESLYFTYPKFSAPNRAGLAKSSSVTIVGAGPIGMIAALTLARYGIACTLIDAKDSFNDGSRAICVARSSFNAFQMLDRVEPFLAKSLPYLSGRTFFRGQQILEFFMPDSAEERYRPMYNIEQQYIEQYLYDGIAETDLIDMRWQTECIHVSQNADGVTLTLRDPNGDYQIHSDWLLAADGARSAIRGMMGLRLQGQNFEGRYVIADIQMHNPVKVERFALFDPDQRPGSTVLVHQQPDNIWRIDYQISDDMDETEAMDEANIRQAVSQVLAECGYDAPWELEWWSTYSANTLLLERYRHGRVFFIGDSAHIVPIFGVRGLNNGILDGINIGWKLAYVIKGWARDALLDSYDHERRQATLDVFDKSEKSTQFMTPRTRGYSIMRDAALSLALDHEFASAFANPRNMTPYEYTDSPLTGADTTSWDDATTATPGAAAPNAIKGSGFLLDECGMHFTLLAFGSVNGLEDISTDLVKIIHLPVNGAAEACHAAEIYDAKDGAAYLLRPDQFIASRWQDAHGSTIMADINRILSGGVTPGEPHV